MDTHDYLFKMLLIGNSGVGKSCLLLRYAVSALNLQATSPVEQTCVNRVYVWLGKQLQRKFLQHNRSGLQDQDDSAGQPGHQATNLGHRGAGAIQDFDSQLLQGRAGHHHRLRHHRPRVLLKRQAVDE